MVMELHVWGPAFDLPSIDPECLAAITFLSAYLPPDQWKLIHSSNPEISPSHALPVLHILSEDESDNKPTWITGYDSITHHLTTTHTLPLPTLAPTQLADTIAYKSHIRQHAPPLLSLSLYISSTNWTTTVRPTYSTILPLPLPYLTPPSLRSRAHKTAAHVNLSSLDTDTLPPSPTDSWGNPTSAAGTPSSLSGSKTFQSLQNRLTSLTSSLPPESRSHIKLTHLTTTFLSPLSALLKSTNLGKTYLISGSKPGTLDCLAYGYLALMLYPPLPRPFLADTMKTRHKDLVAWAGLMRKSCFKRELQTETRRGAAGEVWSRFLGGVLENVPNLGEVYRRWRRMAVEAELGTKGVGWEGYDLLSLVGQASGLGAAGVVLAAYKGLLGLGPWPGRHGSWVRSQSGLAGLGEVGAMLQMAGLQSAGGDGFGVD